MSRLRRPRAVGRPRALAVGVLVAAVVGGCSGGDAPDPDASPPTDAATSQAVDLPDLDATALVVARAPFCDRVEPTAAEIALGAEPADASAYRSGQRVRITDDVADVVHEFGCRWTAGDGTAEAWVFAPPITRRRATALAARAAGQPGCEEVVALADFGRPSSACARRQGDLWSVRAQGLFGDAWLTCSLTLAGTDRTTAQDRASHWCAAIATAASTGGG